VAGTLVVAYRSIRARLLGVRNSLLFVIVKLSNFARLLELRAVSFRKRLNASSRAHSINNLRAAFARRAVAKAKSCHFKN
jgi:hypothetical protein